MFLLNNSNLCYIISIALQVAGALILTVSFWGNTRKKTIDTFFPQKETMVEDVEDIVILKMDAQEIGKNIYLNRFAFVYISLGYLLGIYAQLENIDKSCVAAKIICWAILFIILGNVVSSVISKIVFRKNVKVNYEEIRGRVATAMTEADIDALFDDIFKK